MARSKTPPPKKTAPAKSGAAKQPEKPTRVGWSLRFADVMLATSKPELAYPAAEDRAEAQSLFMTEKGIIVVATVATVFFPFLLRLPRITAIRLFIAGAVYVSGALGLEMIGGYLAETFGQRSVPYVIETLLEESLENIGIVLAFRCLILHLAVVLPPPPPGAVQLRSRLLVWIYFFGMLVLVGGGYAEANVARSRAYFLTISASFSIVAIAIAAVLALCVWNALALSRAPSEAELSKRRGWINLALAGLIVAVAVATGVAVEVPASRMTPGATAGAMTTTVALMTSPSQFTVTVPGPVATPTFQDQLALPRESAVTFASPDGLLVAPHGSE